MKGSWPEAVVEVAGLVFIAFFIWLMFGHPGLP